MGFGPEYILAEGKTFIKEQLALDNHVYKNCTMDRCQIYYSGGPFESIDTHISNSELSLNQPAKNSYSAIQICKVKSPGSTIAGQSPASRPPPSPTSFQRHIHGPLHDRDGLEDRILGTFRGLRFNSLEKSRRPRHRRIAQRCLDVKGTRILGRWEREGFLPGFFRLEDRIFQHLGRLKVESGPLPFGIGEDPSVDPLLAKDLVQVLP